MDTNRFDSLARTLTNRASRRTALRRAAASGLAGIGLGRAAAQDSTPGASSDASPAAAEPGFGQEFLFVQIAESGTWAPGPDEDSFFTLTLTGASSQTIYFSDRPERIVGTVPMQQFLDGLGFTPSNPPNAALMIGTGDEQDVLVIELLNPVYDAENDMLTYDARPLAEYQDEGLQFVLERQTDTELPASFAHPSLYIDDCNDIVHCYSPFYHVIGEVPGAPIGTCWSWTHPKCMPCNGNSLDYYNNLCNQTYPACNDGCGVIVE